MEEASIKDDAFEELLIIADAEVVGAGNRSLLERVYERLLERGGLLEDDLGAHELEGDRNRCFEVTNEPESARTGFGSHFHENGLEELEVS
jgi:hypothetical protein